MTYDSEPSIITYGRAYVRVYEKTEFAATLRRAFIDKKADYIVLDSFATGQRYLAACAAWAIDKGWLAAKDAVDEGQSEIYSFRLTDDGRKALEAS